MAGTATNYDTTKIQAGQPGQIWAGLAIPGAGAMLTLDPDGTPDATANPTAIHIGMTREGSTCEITRAIEEFYADEFPAAVKGRSSQVGMTISAEILQTVDFAVLQKLMQGWGTFATASGYEQIRVGLSATMTYESVAVIFPLEVAGKFGVFHIYQGYVEGGLSAFQVSRKVMSGQSITFKGTAIPSRSATDSIGSYWKQIA